MPRAKRPPQPEVAPEVTSAEAPAATPEEPTVASPGVAPNIPQGPAIEYIDAGAESVAFKANPKATAVRVFANGTIVETF